MKRGGVKLSELSRDAMDSLFAQEGFSQHVVVVSSCVSGTLIKVHTYENTYLLQIISPKKKRVAVGRGFCTGGGMRSGYLGVVTFSDDVIRLGQELPVKKIKTTDVRKIVVLS